MSVGTIFGQLDGEVVTRHHISAGKLSAYVLNYGAVVQDLRFEGHKPPLVLGFENLDDYLNYSPSMGIIAGRFANRIADGRFELDGKLIQLDCNEKGMTHLHGGSVGIGKRIWTVSDEGLDFVTLSIACADGEMGYPGNINISCTYRIERDALVVELKATSDAPTLCNLAHHSYFNLDGSPDINRHELQIAADDYLPVDERDIPTGKVAPVTGTPFDFTKSRQILQGEDGRPFFDHNFCLSAERRELSFAASVNSQRSHIKMDVYSTEPGIQFYGGRKLNVPVAGLEGRRYEACSGLCLEPQVWPDAPNQDGFPSAVLRQGETYKQRTEYRFARSAVLNFGEAAGSAVSGRTA